MPTSIPLRARQILFVAIAAASVLSVLLSVDLSPRIDENFFFASDDPQVEEDRRIRELFIDRPQVIVSARADLMEVAGVRSVQDLHHGPPDLEAAFEERAVAPAPRLRRRRGDERDRSVTAADVALGLAIDDMLHAVYHVRRRRRERKEARGWNDWVAARTELWRATVGGSLIVSIGFSLLFLSAFPPTRRLGLAVVLGTPDLDDPGARRLPAVGVHVRSHRKTALSGPGRLRAVQEARKEGYVGTLEEVVV